MKKHFGLIGERLDYSFSPAYFFKKFKKLNIHAQYEAVEVPQNHSLKAALNQRDWSGMNVTIPYKREIIPLLDSLSRSAREIGAVNTIEFSENQLIGHNTDWIGFTESLPHNNFSKALILGNGGAHKAVLYALKQMAIETCVVARNPKGNDVPWTELKTLPIAQYDLVVHCTPIGTYPNVEDAPDFPYADIQSHQYFYDLIYNPDVTEFLKRAQNAGATIQNGHKMLVLQAEAAWDIWNS